MIAPLTPLPIRGAIWYQGESNSALERYPLYNRIMRALIEDWRRQWGVGAFPFLYVQISNFKSISARRLGQPCASSRWRRSACAIPPWRSPSISATPTTCIPPTRSMSGTGWR